MKLSILIPVFNEAQWLEAFWARFQQAPINLCQGITAVEIVIVDDGSVDGSREILKTFASRAFHFTCGMNADVQLFLQPQNRGKGSAIRAAIQASTGDIVIIQDADLEYSVFDYPALMQPFARENADAVFGTRFSGASRRVLLFWHMVGNRLFTLLSNAFSNLNLTDMECGYKAMRGDLVRRLHLVSPRFGIEPELTAKLATAKARIFEVPVSYAGRSYAEGKKIGMKDAIAALFHIIRFCIFDRRPFMKEGEKPVSDLLHFNPGSRLKLTESKASDIGREPTLSPTL